VAVFVFFVAEEGVCEGVAIRLCQNPSSAESP
jgi:hypothetical protein